MHTQLYELPGQWVQEHALVLTLPSKQPSEPSMCHERPHTLPVHCLCHGWNIPDDTPVDQ